MRFRRCEHQLIWFNSRRVWTPLMRVSWWPLLFGILRARCLLRWDICQAWKLWFYLIFKTSLGHRGIFKMLYSTLVCSKALPHDRRWDIEQYLSCLVNYDGNKPTQIKFNQLLTVHLFMTYCLLAVLHTQWMNIRKVLLNIPKNGRGRRIYLADPTI